MNKKELPKPKKTLKSFILEEDAKIMDKTATKIALTLSFLSISTIINAEDAHAQGHHSHSNHENHLFKEGDYDIDKHEGDTVVHQREYLKNNNEEPVEHEEIIETRNGDEVVTVGAKDLAVNAAHGNHYNHASGGQQ